MPRQSVFHLEDMEDVSSNLNQQRSKVEAEKH